MLVRLRRWLAADHTAGTVIVSWEVVRFVAVMAALLALFLAWCYVVSLSA